MAYMAPHQRATAAQRRLEPLAKTFEVMPEPLPAHEGVGEELALLHARLVESVDVHELAHDRRRKLEHEDQLPHGFLRDLGKGDGQVRPALGREGRYRGPFPGPEEAREGLAAEIMAVPR